jgi:hypothetical protein
MAFTGNFMCTSFKQQILEGVHDFRATSGDVFNIALYTNSASFTAATTAYTASDEITNASGSAYVAGGQALDNVNPSTSGTTALTDFADETWSTASFTARGAMIYNSTPTHTYTNPSVLILDFGSDKTAVAGDFTVVFPTPDASNAILRIA